MSDAQPKPAPAWAQRPGETFAEYLERWHEEIATDAERAELAAAARADRAEAVADAPER